jgi:hypothetical protein
VLPITEPPFDPLRFPSEVGISLTIPNYGLRYYKTRDVQTLSNGTDPTYEAWSIQLNRKFLEPQFTTYEERVRIYYIFGVTSGIA